MREIKFRVWDVSDKKMFDADYYHQFYRTSEYGGLHDWLNPNKNDYIVMQYIGMKDIDGEEIYEEDILKTPDEPPLEICVCKYMNGRFVLCNDLHKSQFDLWSAGRAKIVGNIYENPELVERLEE
jgi:uncharacterized phage protein (TIGR01671 family)